MKIVLQVVVLGMVSMLCACSGKPDTPAPKAQQAVGQASVVQPVAAPVVKEEPRHGGRLVIAPVSSDKFNVGPKSKAAGGGGTSAGSK